MGPTVARANLKREQLILARFQPIRLLLCMVAVFGFLEWDISANNGRYMHLMAARSTISGSGLACGRHIRVFPCDQQRVRCP